MQNLFDVSNYSSQEPTVVVKGDFWAWKRPDISDVYPPSEYDLKYRFINLDNEAEFEFVATEVDGVFIVEFDSGTENNATAGKHSYSITIIRSSDNKAISLAKLFMTVLSQAGAASQNYQILQAIRATILKTASKEQQAYSVAGRSLSRRSPDELIKMEKEYSKRVYNEEKQAAKAAGRKVKSSNTYVRLS